MATVTKRADGANIMDYVMFWERLGGKRLGEVRKTSENKEEFIRNGMRDC